MNEKPREHKALSGEDEGLPHGGDWVAAERRFGRPEDGWLDLSTGINPHSYPVADVDMAAWQRLPDTRAMAALLAAAAAYYGARDVDGIVAAPGSQAAMQWLPRLRARSRVAVVAPTYGEHAHTWRLAGHDVTEVGVFEDADADVVVVVNPNNPDVRVVAPKALVARAERLAKHGGLLVVDEAFADAAPYASVAAFAGTDGLAVLRSFGKFFGLAGARLGFVLAPAALADSLRRALGPWAVAGPAMAVATRAFSDEAWIATSRAHLAVEMGRLRALLAEHGFAIVGGTNLFTLVETPDAALWFAHLARHGILVRAFADHPRWLRFGLPGHGHWPRLEDALAAFSVAEASPQARHGRAGRKAETRPSTGPNIK
jgi:cobalamin biosynthetic protein CobC